MPDLSVPIPRWVAGMIGKKFHRLTVTAYSHRTENPKAKWREWKHFVFCDCDCGVTSTVKDANTVKYGNLKSCGCYHDIAARTHGQTHTGEYNSWKEMKRRCLRPTADNYERYGGRGITVCAQWLGTGGFDRFIADLGHKPEPRYTLDRIDNNGNYEPGNCKWSTPSEQQRNRRGNRMLTIFGHTLCLTAWVRLLKIDDATLKAHLAKGDLESFCSARLVRDSRTIESLGLQHSQSSVTSKSASTNQ